MALRVLAPFDQGQPASGNFFGTPIKDYRYHQTFDSGRNEKFIIIVGARIGYIFAFHVDGSFAAATETKRIESLTAVDLNSDGHTELILGQLDAYGTGLAWRNYHVYVLSGSELTDSIVGELHVYEGARTDEDDRPIVDKDISGFIRIDEGRHTDSRVIIHAAFDAKTAKYTQKAYQLKNGKIVEVPVPPTAW